MKHFFHAGRIRFPAPITSPVNNRGRYFTFWWNTVPAVKYEATFATNWWVQGDYVATTGTNPPVAGKIFIFDTWTQNPYSGWLSFADDSGKEFNFALGFNPGKATNRFSGTLGAGPISGVFTMP